MTTLPRVSQRRLTHYRAIWYLDYLGYNLSAAVSVGIIALAGVVMLVYLDEAFERRVHKVECNGARPE